MNNNEYDYSQSGSASRESYSAPSYSDEELGSEGYTTATKPDPAENVRTVRRARPSKAARICMWIVGIIAGATVVFTCVLVWISGLQFLGVLGGNEQVIVSEKDEPDVYNFYVYGDSVVPDSSNGDSGDFGNFEEYFDYFFGNGGTDGSGNNGAGGSGADSSEPQGKAGLGITILALELEFTIDGKYTGGLVIDTIEDYSSFIGTDVRVNDMIVAVEGEACPTIEVLQKHLEGKSIGDELTVTIARYSGGVATTFEVTVNLIEMQNN